MNSKAAPVSRQVSRTLAASKPLAWFALRRLPATQMPSGVETPSQPIRPARPMAADRLGIARSSATTTR